jgi:tetratricopeptide (TPR) repeat protein
VLIVHDTKSEDRQATGLPLEDIVRALRRVNLFEAFLFLDACQLQLAAVPNVLAEELLDKDVLSASAFRRAFFCFLSAGTLAARELRKERKGIFTSALLKHMARLSDTSDARVSVLANAVEDELVGGGHPRPVSYLLGSTQSWPLTAIDSGEDDPRLLLSTTAPIARTSACRLLVDSLVSAFPCPVWLWGASGIGKSELVRQFVAQQGRAVYWTMPISGVASIDDANLAIALTIADQLVAIFPAGAPLESAAATLVRAAEKTPGLIVVLDHMERTTQKMAEGISKSLEAAGIQCLLVSREPLVAGHEILSIESPPLSLGEAKQLAESYSIGASDIAPLLAATKGNALRLKELAANLGGKRIVDGRQLAASAEAKAIVASQGFLDVELFCDEFGIHVADVISLQNCGLLIQLGHEWIPHDQLRESAHIESVEIYERAAKYWSKQMMLIPTSSVCGRRLIDALLNCGQLRTEFDQAIVQAVHVLWTVRDWFSLTRLSNFYRKRGPSVDSFAGLGELTSIFVEQGRREDAESLLRILGSATDDHLRWHHLWARARFSWWNGRFDDCERLAKEALAGATDEVTRAKANLEIGISLFFRGEWNPSKERLTVARRIADRDPRTKAWADLLLGTIDALRGVDVAKGKRQLESAIHALSALDDRIGEAIARGNLAEALWKNGEYERAWALTSVALESAREAGNSVNELECLRTQLQIAIRFSRIPPSESARLLEHLTAVDGSLHGSMEMMQIYDTLATAHLYRGDVENADRFVSKSETMTAGNREYSIYSSANRAMVEALRENEKLGIEKARYAIALAISGENKLAIKQMRDDAAEVLKRGLSATADRVAEIFLEAGTEKSSLLS